MTESIDPALINEALECVRKPLEHGSHLPGALYTSQQVLDREMDKIFRVDWLCVGREEEVANPGDYMATRILNEPIIVTRDETGGLNAFSNICRHRGVQVAENGCGNAKRLTCPYHGWSYDIKGRLVAAPLMDQSEGFDVKSVHLPVLHVGAWAGWVFVTLNPDPAPLESFVESFENDIGFLQLGRCRVGRKLITTWDCNWKMVTENLCDPYHFRALHGKTFGPRIPVESYLFELRDRGGNYAFYDAASQTPSGDTPLGAMPWLSNYSQGMSAFGFMAPNMATVGRVDEAHVYTVWPEAIDRTRVVLYHLFAEEHFALPEFEEKSKVYSDFMAQVVSEDASVAPLLQQGAASANFNPGRLSWLEKAVHHQMRYTVERTFG